MVFSLLIRRRLRHFFIPPKPPPRITFPDLRHFTATAAAAPAASTEPDPKLSLSSRLSFVFDQIDALERQRDTSAKDEALQRIRAWRLAKHPPPPPPPPSPSSTSTSVASVVTNRGGKNADKQTVADADRAKVGMAEFFQREMEVVHPWPEWIELMERLASQNYFDYRRVEEKRVACKAGIDLSVVKEMGLDLTRDWAAVRTACMNFGRDRFDILKSLSRKDIQSLVGHGCPNMSPKVVFSAKLLRKYVHVDEGDVCSSCPLRNTCSRGYILVPKEDEARTLDVMRILLTYGFDHVKESVENDTLRKMKSVKTAIRKLLHEVVKLSAVPRDPNLLPPVIKKPPKVKQPPPQPKRRVGRDDIEMKKGDWLCSKCDFMNFAKNTVCLQCDAQRPKRQLLPGEWECPKCSFLNYRRNMSCFQCEHTRPPDEFTENQMQRKRENQMQGKQVGPNTRLQRSARASDVSNAWNFDFDDDESDGADVAAFEFADSSKAQNGSNLDEPPRGGNSRGFEDDIAHQQDRGRYLTNPRKGNHPSNSHVRGFDDFDDEEDDNLDDYELDEANGKETHEVLRKSLSEFETGSESDDFDDHDHHAKSNQHRKESLSDSEDDVIVSARKTSLRSFDSSDDMEPLFDSKNDKRGHFDLKQRKRGQQNAGQKGLTRGKDLDFDDELGSDSDDDDLYSRRSKKKVAKDASERTGRNFQESHHVGSINNRRNSFSNDLYSCGSSGKVNRSTSDSTGRRYPDSSRFSSKNSGRASFSHRDGDKFEQKGSNVKRRDRINQSNDGARGFQKSKTGSKGNGFGRHRNDHGNQNSIRMADHSKTNYRQHKRNDSRGFNDDFGVDDNNRRRRIIER